MKRHAAIMLFVLLLPRVGASSSLYPDATLTPGEVFPGLTTKDVCTNGYARRTRHVTSATKRQVFRIYGVQYVPHAYEVDHFIPLTVGGTNSIKNLWPEPLQDALDKDQVENWLHHRVCDGTYTLEEAQTMIRQDWKKVFNDHHLSRPH